MNIKKYVKSHSVLVATLAILAVVLMSVAGRMVASKNTSELSGSNVRQVALVDVRTFRDDLSTVSVDGVVESASQVDIKSQVSAPVATVYFSVGDNVAQGQTIMELQNADIRAQLDQARANLTLVRGQYSSGDVAVNSTRKAAIDRIRDSYTKADDAITGQIGQFLYNGNPNNPQLQEYVGDSTVLNALSLKWTATLEAIRVWKVTVDSLSDTSSQAEVDAALNLSQKTLATVSGFLDTLSAALVSATRSSTESNLALVNSWKAIASAARATTNASISSFTSTGTSFAANDAQISAAEAGVKALQAQLAKTIITAPISGTIASLPLRTGEYASMGQSITTIVGSGGLQIKAFASSEDIDRIEKGAPVTVQGTVPGIVGSIAPSVNQITKKVEVKILVPAGERSNLVVGQSVQAKIVAPAKTSVQTAVSVKSSLYVLPIQNVKIIPGGAYVYTVDADSKIVRHEVVLGEVKGDFVEIKSGIAEDMKIVSPVYELEEGEVVRAE